MAMDLIATNCPSCGEAIEFPNDSLNVICSSCRSSYNVRRGTGTFSLVPTGSDHALELESTEFEERVTDLTEEIEAIRSKEKGAPLQTGCALFFIFFLAILVITFYMTLGINYFGKWPFYVTLAVVVVLGLARVRRRLATP